MSIPTSISVRYRAVGDVHVFTSSELPGLYHAHRDLRRAFDTLPETVSDLVRLEFGKAEHYVLDKDFDAFRHEIELSDEMLPFFKLTADQHAAA